MLIVGSLAICLPHARIKAEDGRTDDAMCTPKPEQNLLLLRFLNLQYAEVFKLADCCVSDTALSREESLILGAASPHTSHLPGCAYAGRNPGHV